MEIVPSGAQRGPIRPSHPANAGIHYAAASHIQFYHNRSGILDHPLEPVIGRRAAPTRWRMMTSRCAATAVPFPTQSGAALTRRSASANRLPKALRDAEFARLGELGAGILTGDDIIGLRRVPEPRNLGAETLRHRLGFVAGEFSSAIP